MPTIRDVVQALARRQGIKAVILLGRDGLPIDSAVRNGLDSEGVAALIPPMVSACVRLGGAADCGEFGASAVEFAGGMAVITMITPDTLLAMVAAPETNLGGLLYELRKHRAAIAGLL